MLWPGCYITGLFVSRSQNVLGRDIVTGADLRLREGLHPVCSLIVINAQPGE
jgi:hypothetical protein